MSLSAILGDEVEIEVGGQTVVLKPTLRAGIGVLRLHGSFAKALQLVQELDTRTLERVIDIGSANAVWPGLVDRMTMLQISYFTGSLGSYIVTLANGGTTPTERHEEDLAAKAPSDTHEAYFARLFKIGVGWMGWSAEETLDTSMPAILSAYAGRVDMLRAIFGGGAAQTRNDIPLEDKVRAFFQHLGTTKVGPS